MVRIDSRYSESAQRMEQQALPTKEALAAFLTLVVHHQGVAVTPVPSPSELFCWRF